jgi:hypothetical protein
MTKMNQASSQTSSLAAATWGRRDSGARRMEGNECIDELAVKDVDRKPHQDRGRYEVMSGTPY